VDETYVSVAGVWTYLYRAVDFTSETIDFMLSPKRDIVAAKHFLQMALWRTGQIRPRVINVDGHAAYQPGAPLSRHTAGFRVTCERARARRRIFESRRTGDCRMSFDFR
jgi:transposase-like protein